MRGLRDCLRISIAFVCLGAAGWTDNDGRGIVIERVVARSSSDNPQIEAGDLLIHWSQGTHSGDLSTPFDLAAVEIEQAPRGPVTVSGLRQGREMKWTFDPAAWEVISRPNLNDPLLGDYRRARQLAGTKGGDEARTLQKAAESETAAHDVRVSSWLYYEAAEAFGRAGDAANCDRAYRSAFERLPESSVEGRAFLWREWASQLISRQNWPEVEKAYRESLALTSKKPDLPLTTAASIQRVGYLARRRGELKAAEQFYTEALDIRRREAPNSIDTARSLNDLGAVAQERNDLPECRRYYTEAMTLAEKAAPGSLDVARNLIGLGFLELYHDLGKAEEYYLNALVIQERVAPGSLNVAQTLIHLGLAKFSGGDLAHAEEYYRKGLAIERRLAPRSRDAANCLLNLGNTVRARGDLTHAEQYYIEALRIYEELNPSSLDVARVLNSLGSVARARGDLDTSEKYQRRALELKQQLVPNSEPVAVSLTNLGNLQQQRGDFKNAAGSLHEALSIYERTVPGSSGHSAALASLGDLAINTHHPEEAERYFRSALAIDEKITPGSTNHAESLEAVGRALRARGHPDEAEDYIRRSLDALETQTSRLGGTEGLRAGFRAQYAGFYREHLEVLLQGGRKGDAFQTLERSRGRAFLAMLAERDAVFGSEMPPDQKDALSRNASSYDHVQAQLSGLSATRDREKIDRLHAELRRLSDERDQLIEQVRVASPRLASVRYPKPLDAPAAFDALDAGTVLLSYSTGPKDTVLFALRKGKPASFLESYPVAASSEQLRLHVERLRQSLQKHGSAAEEEFRSEARALYDLLVKPAETVIEKANRVLVVADGPLHSLPFGSLVRGDGRYLIQAKAVHSVLSMTTYAELLKSRANAPRYRYELAAFGDPHYPDIAGNPARSTNRELEAAVERGFIPAPLPFSRHEVTAIADLFPGRSRTFLGPAATEEQAKALSTEARYIHFAAHGIIDEKFPLDSALVLSIPDHIKEGQDNGLLQAWEILQSVRWNAELVTLSACRTALGRELSGEGLIGLTRAIQYAGARSVVATLWSVDDRRTAELMRVFYRRLAAGESKDEALRAAQLDFLKSPDTARPEYWAAFILNGDWR